MSGRNFESQRCPAGLVFEFQLRKFALNPPVE